MKNNYKRKNSEEWYDEGMYFKKHENYSKAICCYERALELNQNHYHARMEKGCLLNDIGHNGATRFNLNDPVDEFFWIEQKQKFAANSSHIDEMRCYNVLLTLNPTNSQVLSMKGYHLQIFKKYSSAIECYDKALAVNPEDATTWARKGECWYSLNEYNIAIECYDESLKLNPLNTGVQNRKHRCFQLCNFQQN